MSRMIGVVSGKGGVGKTTIIANLGVAISQFDKNPLLVDTNIRAASLGIHLGFYEDLPANLVDIVNKKAPLGHGIFIHPKYNLKFLPAPIEGTSSELEGEEKLLRNLKNHYDIILSDLAPSFSEEAIKVINSLDEGLVISTPRIPAVADAMRTIKILRENDKEILGIVLNKVEGGDDEISKENIESRCGEDVIAEIPYDKKVRKAVSEGIPVVEKYPNSSASVQMKKLAAKLLDINWEPPGIFERIKGLFGLQGRKGKSEMAQELEKPEAVGKLEETGNTCEICGREFNSERGLNIHKA